MNAHVGRLLCGLLTTSLCLSACGSADSEYEAKLLRNMQNIGNTMQEARSCGLDDQHLPGHSSAYSESFALAERTGFTSKKKLEAAYRKGVESAAAKPPSEAKCSLLRESATALDAGQARIAAAMVKSTATDPK